MILIKNNRDIPEVMISFNYLIGHCTPLKPISHCDPAGIMFGFSPGGRRYDAHRRLSTATIALTLACCSHVLHFYQEEPTVKVNKRNNQWRIEMDWHQETDSQPNLAIEMWQMWAVEGRTKTLTNLKMVCCKSVITLNIKPLKPIMCQKYYLGLILGLLQLTSHFQQ